eukprot:2208705-Prymnesium_polylepis.1
MSCAWVPSMSAALAGLHASMPDVDVQLSGRGAGRHLVPVGIPSYCDWRPGGCRTRLRTALGSNSSRCAPHTSRPHRLGLGARGSGLGSGLTP